MLLIFLLQVWSNVMELFTTLTLEQLAQFVYGAFALGYLITIVKRKRKDIWGSIVGEDGRLEWTEFIGFIWAFSFLYLLFAESVLSMEVGEQLWKTMEHIFFAIVARDVGLGYVTGIRNKFNSNNTKQDSDNKVNTIK